MVERRRAFWLGSCAGVAVAICAAPTRASERVEVRASYAIDIPVVLGAWGMMFALSQVPVDARHRWNREPLGLDQRTRGAYQRLPAIWSDRLLVGTLVMPVGAELASGLDSGSPDRGTIYLETLGIAGLLNSGIKLIVQRPRPLVYDGTTHHDNDGDSRLSFYSGHSTMAFASAVSGAYLFAGRSESEHSRLLMWTSSMTLAAATAQLRVRARKHFPSDVLVGSVVGAGLGIAIPKLHSRPMSGVTLSWMDGAAVGGGLLLGTAVAWALPIGDDPPAQTAWFGWHVAPSISSSQSGLELGGWFL